MTRHVHRYDGEPGPRLSRRGLLAAGCVAVPAAAGCVDRGPAERPEPVAIAAGDQCDACGMVVADHPGPVGEVFYREHTPEGHPDPARFDSLRGCLFPYYFEHERRGWEPAAVYTVGQND